MGRHSCENYKKKLMFQKFAMMDKLHFLIINFIVKGDDDW